MSDKEKIRNKVEVLYCMTKRCETVGNAAFNTACKEILDFIDSLPEEPISENLEKEISLFLLRNEIINHSENGLKNYVTNVARHFANWQREQIMNSVEEAAKEYSRSITEGNVIDECFVEDFKAGAIWREQQMMQNAVKGVITSFTDHNHLCIMLDVPIGSLNYCDRVEVIIIKKE